MERGKKGQILGMSFGVIFAIFMILVFIALAFIVIGHFLDIGECGEVGNFYEDLQKEVENVMQQQYHESEFKINLPSGIERVCFADLSAQITGFDEDYEEIEIYEFKNANIFLIPPEKSCEGLENNLIKHIDIEKIIKDRNPYCIDVERQLKIKKGFSDKAVTIE